MPKHIKSIKNSTKKAIKRPGDPTRVAKNESKSKPLKKPRKK